MENIKEAKKSRPVSFLLLIPSLLLGIISLAMAIVGLGMIPLLPAAAGILLGVISYFVFRGSYVTFTKIVIGVSIVAALMSVFRSTLIKGKVTDDQSFDSTMVNTQQGIDGDLEDAFSSDSTDMQ
ncbi:MAG: hypothetical protein IPN68_19115 [Bacteroidetes bacterium]|nr:hypothetical protein [Bacteroidota bacterium]